MSVSSRPQMGHCPCMLPGVVFLGVVREFSRFSVAPVKRVERMERLERMEERVRYSFAAVLADSIPTVFTAVTRYVCLRSAEALASVNAILTKGWTGVSLYCSP